MSSLSLRSWPDLLVHAITLELVVAEAVGPAKLVPTVIREILLVPYIPTKCRVLLVPYLIFNPLDLIISPIAHS